MKRTCELTKGFEVRDDNIGETVILQSFDGKHYIGESFLELNGKKESVGRRTLTAGEVRRMLHWATGKYFDLIWVDAPMSIMDKLLARQSELFEMLDRYDLDNITDAPEELSAIMKELKEIHDTIQTELF